MTDGKSTAGMNRSSKLSMQELLGCCKSLHQRCEHCTRPMPSGDTAPRPCPALNDSDDREALERKMRGTQ